MDLAYFLNNLWLWKAGKPENQLKNIDSLESLKQSEWSEPFEKLMRNRMIMGAFRYGKLLDKSKAQFDRINSIKKRLDIYSETGNTEHLVDAANLCLLEFVEGDHPKKHFHSIDNGIHTDIKQNGA